MTVAAQRTDTVEASIEITPELMAGFLDEANEHLSALNTHLMEFEREAESGPIAFDRPEDASRMTEMFRAAHSLKGLSATFAFVDINQLTHRMETLFDEARNRRRTFDSEILGVLLNCVGVLELLVRDLESPGATPPDAQPAMQQLDALMKRAAGAAAPPAVSESNSAQADPAGTPAAEAADAAADATGASAGGIPESLLSDPALRKLFVETTAEAVDELNDKLLRLEGEVSEELLNAAFRVAHSLKGACGAAGLQDATRLTHEMESCFDRLRSGTVSMNDGLMSAFLTVADRLQEVVEEIKTDRYSAWPANRVDSVFAAIAASGPTAGAAAGAAATDAAQGGADDPRAAARRQAGRGYYVVVTFDDQPTDVDFQELLILNRLKSYGEVVWMTPNLETGDRGGAMQAELIVAAPDASESAIETIDKSVRAFKPRDVTITVFVEPTGAAAPAATPTPPTPTPAALIGEVVLAEDGAKTSAPPARPAPPAASAAPKPSSAHAPPAAGKPAPAAPKPAARPAEGATGPAAAPAADAAARRPATPTSTATIRVDVDRLDQLMNLGGELVINRARFAQMSRELKHILDGKDVSYLAEQLAQQLAQSAQEARTLSGQHAALAALAERLTHMSHEFAPLHEHVRQVHGTRGTMHSFEEAVNTLGRISENLQKRIMETRMVPVGPLFQRFNRMTRDMAKELGKKIEFETVGEQTELDKKMIDELADPLTHMIRNSADHGIELPEARVAAGKPAAARITLSAYHQGNSICIEVRDDGRGIDVARIREKLVERELMSEAQAAQMSERELLQQIFAPGFSTAKQVSDLSGRGMGMDIVKTKIANLSGTVDVQTEVGVGTTVTIRLPLTLAIITALQTRIGSEVYCLPLESVAEIVTLNRRDVHSVQGQRVARIRDAVIPIYMLEEVLDLRATELRTRCRDAAEWTIVIIGSGVGRMGLVVDSMVGREDVVIKSLAENYRNVSGLAGATIMGDGRVSLILDVSRLSGGRARGPAGEAARPGAPMGATTAAPGEN